MRTGACFGGDATGVFFAGLAPTDAFASTHRSEHKTAKRVLANRSWGIGAVSSYVAMMPCEKRGSKCRRTAFQTLKPSCGRCTTTKLR